MGSDTLIIVESNGKCKKIESLTGHKCIASFGHIFGLQPTLKWFDPNDINPKYITITNKSKCIQNLKSCAKKAKKIIIASDLDREGEAIAAHLMDLLKLNVEKTDRITFNQISKQSLTYAIQNPKRLDINLYNAQKARSIIDLVFGFLLSPFISKHLHIYGLSAGRCQTPAIRIIHSRQIEQKIGNIELITESQASFNDNIFKVNHLKPKILKDDIISWIDNLKNQQFLIIDKTKRKKFENPQPPLITSSLQQVAYNKHGLNTKNTMKIAQSLYEKGYITYMRTDSVTISIDFQQETIEWINKYFGKEYSSPRQFSKKKGVITQDAHEAIRPINIYKTPPSNSDELKIYKIIWMRAIQSQMTKASYDEIKLSLQTSRNTTIKDYWESIEKQIEFPGHLLLNTFSINFSKSDIETQNTALINKNTHVFDNISKNSHIDIHTVSVKEKSITPKAPYNTASFVKALENSGIGRPSTYSNIVEKIMDKGYVCIGQNPMINIELNQWNLDTKNNIIVDKYTQKFGGQNKVYLLTELGKKVCEFIDSSPIEPIVNVNFTAKFEDKLDDIAKGGLNWKLLIHSFHTDLVNNLSKHEAPKIIKNPNNWLRILTTDDDIEMIGILKSKHGFYLGKKSKDNDSETIKTSCMFPGSNINDITLEEAIFMYNLPKNIQNNTKTQLFCGPYGWYTSNGNKKIPIHNKRQMPTDKEVIDALHTKKENSIIETISSHWTLRKKKKSYYLMFKKDKCVKFYSVSEKLFEETDKWTIEICENIKNK